MWIQKTVIGINNLTDNDLNKDKHGCEYKRQELILTMWHTWIWTQKIGIDINTETDNDLNTKTDTDVNTKDKHWH